MKGWLSWYKDLKKKKKEKKQNKDSKKTESSEKQNTQTEAQKQAKSVYELSNDFKEVIYPNKATGEEFVVSFYTSLSETKIIEQFILPKLLEQGFKKLEDITDILSVPGIKISDFSCRDEHLLRGSVEIRISGDKERAAYLEASKNIGRNIAAPEVEFSVIGPKEAFVESYGQNINLLRKRLPIKELVIIEKIIGKYSKTKVGVAYIQGLANEENINTIMQRLDDMEYDNIPDSSFIEQIISDQHNSPFPLALDTERPDRAASVLTEGKIVIISDGSPHVLIAPTTLIEFFSSFDDYLTNWMLASFFRVIRLFSVAFSILITPIYVAALTYHYELIPGDLMGTLVASRQVVPLPPFFEALFLELVIELLREAGARLPTKVGQTIGIVGGIVIGTASVEAGLTSNVLLILIALAALASFTTPVYKIGNAIRVLRFPFLIFAQLWGLLGIVYCFAWLMTYTLNLTSLGRPFLEPLYPPRLTDFRDAIFRLPFRRQTVRPMFTRTKKPEKIIPKDLKKTKDIDE
ncbi:GerA spore germination protein [Bacillus oleivorans]|uniref:GerA spore germination protein n=1 Tax=Bacillus oleivorans TaxID=1448271 RepID=A0A285CY15_9BACI|nr:spore germination protein [Bacillus oleivorans]SNX72430.1 GerA spore germination protein [Bacillus oleivorans]